MVRAGVIGASGYTGGELVRLLLNHPFVEIGFVYSSTHSKEKITNVHKDLVGETDLVFSESINTDKLDVLFLCLPHGNSQNFLDSINIHADLKIIDLSNDFRLSQKNSFKEITFKYGLPEVFRNEIRNSNYISNPGCFATAVQLALLPLASKKLLRSPIHVNATTGSTGAGYELKETTGFTWRHSNFSSYNEFKHPHLAEITETIKKLNGDSPEVNFIPNRGNFTRGIFCSSYMDISNQKVDYERLYHEYYSNEPFTYVVDFEPDIKNVINTNKCFINVKVAEGKLLITSVIDNLLKGASGQAVQNMNIMFGFDEKSGLKIKASVY
jgi:N-acetyl-gamma-glutamyl-phosphate reductase